jgi:hypothetical protein
MEKFEIIGNNETDKKDIQERLERVHAKGDKKTFSELPKFEDTEKIISLANSLLATELERLGLEYAEADPNRIHPLDEWWWKIKYVEDKSHGKFDPYESSIAVNEDAIAKTCREKELNLPLKRFTVILHEMIHLAGKKKFFMNHKNQLDAYRVGYSTRPRSAETPLDASHLKGFNEAIVDGINRMLVRNNWERIQNELGITDMETALDKDELFDYDYHVDILALIVEKIADKTGEDVLVVRDRIIKGQFTGEMMHLRDLEKAYGKRALRVLAFWGDNDQDVMLRNKILHYIEAETQEQRDAIADDLLGPVKEVKRSPALQ